MGLRLVSREFEGFERSFGSQIESFRKSNPDIEIEAEFLDLATLHTQMLGGGGAKRGEADLFLCVTDWLPEAIAGGHLTSLNDFLASYPPQDWPDGWSPSMRGLQTSADGQIYGLPYHDGPEVFMYRRDLFDDLEERRQFEARFLRPLAPPETWTEFVEVAKFFTRPDKGLWGTCLAGFPDAHNNVYDFMLQLWSRGGELLNNAGRPRFQEAEGRQALTFLYDLYHTYQVVSPDCLNLDSVASGMYYAAGNAAMMWNWSGFAAVAEDPSVSKIVGNNAVCALPKSKRSVSLNIYWVLTIPSGCRDKDAAYKFLRHVCSPEMDKATSMLGGNGTRLSTWRDAEVQATFPYYQVIEEIHRSVESPPSIPEFTMIAEILNRAVDDALHRRKSIDDALTDSAMQVDSLLVRQ